MSRRTRATRVAAASTALIASLGLSVVAVAPAPATDICATDLTVGTVADGMCTIVVWDVAHTNGENFVTPAGVTRLWLTVRTGDGASTYNGTVRVPGGKGVTMLMTIPVSTGQELGVAVTHPTTDVTCPGGDPAGAAGGMAFYMTSESRVTGQYRGWIPGGGGAGCSDGAVAGGAGGDAPVWDGDPNHALVLGEAGESGEGIAGGGGGQTGNYTGGAHGAPAGNDGYTGDGGAPLAGAVPGGGGSSGCYGAGSGGTTSAGSGGGGGGSAMMLVEADTLILASSGGMAPGASQITIQFPMPQGPPRHLAATGGNARVSLTWEAPDYAADYQIRFRIDTGRWSRARNTHSQETTYVVTRLKNGHAYDFEVRAGSTGAWSAIATATPQSPPSVVRTLQAKATLAKNGKGQVRLTWLAPAAGATPTAYKVDYLRQGSIPSSQIRVKATHATLSGLTPGARYVIAVTAVSSYGNGRSTRVTVLIPRR